MAKKNKKKQTSAAELMLRISDTAKQAGYYQARTEQLLRERESLINQIQVLHHDSDRVQNLEAGIASLEKEKQKLAETIEGLKKENDRLRDLGREHLAKLEWLISQQDRADEAPAPREKLGNAPGENPAEIYEKCIEAAAADADPAEDVPEVPAPEEKPESAPGENSAELRPEDVSGEIVEDVNAAPAAAEPADQNEEKVLIIEEKPEMTVGDVYGAEPFEGFEKYPLKPTGKKKAAEKGVPKEADAAAAEDEPLPVLPPDKAPVWDPELEMYLCENTAFIGKDLWNQKKYKGWFNEEIRQLRAAGKSQQYIADRLRVTQRSVSYRISLYHLDA